MPQRKHLLVALFFVTAFLGGLARQIFAPGQLFSGVDVPITLVGILLIFLWYRTDAQQLAFRRSPVLNVMVIAITLFALPYYFFRSRGFLRGCIATALFLAVSFAYSAFELGGEYVAYYGLQS